MIESDPFVLLCYGILYISPLSILNIVKGSFVLKLQVICSRVTLLLFMNKLRINNLYTINMI